MKIQLACDFYCLEDALKVLKAVSYTHLDVYKRQEQPLI